MRFQRDPNSVSRRARLRGTELFTDELLEPRVLLQATSFAAPTNVGADAAPIYVVTADLNGDGKLDLAAADYSSNTVSVRLGAGDGTFGPPTLYSVGPNPRSIAVGDFTGSGKLDLAVSVQNGYPGPGDLLVLMGNGDGTFGSPITYPLGLNTGTIALGDFNDDGKLDIVVANANGNDASIFLGKGDGTFAAPTTLAAGGGPISVAVGDFNRDGKPDLAIPNSNDNTVSILLGTGGGTFTPQVTYAAGGRPMYAVVGDFNGDGNQDLAVAGDSGGDAGTGGVSILLGNGDGTFSPPASYATNPYPYMIAAGDFNGDGTLDLVTPSPTDDGSMSDGISVLPGKGDGTFAPVEDFGVGAGPVCVAVGDFNGDGKPDLAVADADGNTTSILLNTSQPSAATTTLTANSVAATYGSTAVLSATLTSSGHPLPNEIVNFSVAGTAIGSATTDQNGVAAFAYALGTLGAGNYPVQATFAGDPVHQASAAGSALTVTDQNCQGMIWVDFNNDGNVDFGEQGIGGVPITLTNSAGHVVGQTTSDPDGLYTFNHIPPDTYSISEGGIPAGYVPGRDSLGTITDLNGNVISVGVGHNAVQNIFSAVAIAPDQNAVNYNFGAQPAPGAAVGKGQAAGIGFWQNKNGQALIQKFSAIGSWLAATLPHTFGSLAGSSSQQVASLYQQEFVLKDKLDAQFMATALNVYATDASLGGSHAGGYGFTIGTYGLGNSTWSVSSDGTAFSVANNASLTVMQLLQAWDQQAKKSNTALRKLALDAFGGINSAGGI
jgi:hypothetical protein